MLTVKGPGGPGDDGGDVVAGRPGPSRFDAVARSWLAALPTAGTRDAYRRDLRAFAGWCAAGGADPLDAAPADVARYRDECGSGGSAPATVARRLSAVSSFYRHAAGADAVASNPAAGVARPLRRQASAGPLDDREVEALLGAAAVVGTKAAVLVCLLVLDGLKLGEALALDVAGLTGSAPAMTATVGCRGACRSVGLDARTAEAVARHLGDRRAGPLLAGGSPTGPGDRRLTRFGADFVVKRAAERAGLRRPVSANVLRRTYVARAHRDGVPLDDIRRQVGHRERRDTRRLLG
ncbi:MAG: tyrosine-type recombinase/integrase [Acidimicrobiia bacterium]